MTMAADGRNELLEQVTSSGIPAPESGAPVESAADDDHAALDESAASPGEKESLKSEAERYWVLWWVLGLSVAAMLATLFQLMGWPLHPDRLYTYKGFALALAFVVTTVAAMSDSATRRIPNVLTYPAILLGLGLSVVVWPILMQLREAHPMAETALVWLAAPGIIGAVMGFMACAGIGIFSFMFRGLGGGDVKLIAAIGAILGFQESIAVLFNALVFACIIGIVNLMFKGNLVRKIQAMSMALQVNLTLRKKALDVYPFGKSEAPFGVAVLLGLICAQWAPLWEPILKFLNMGG